MRKGRRKSQAGEPSRDVAFPTYGMGKPKIDLAKALQIAGELENQEILRKRSRPKGRNALSPIETDGPTFDDDFAKFAGLRWRLPGEERARRNPG
jgi:hypothetical protein